MTQPSTVTVPPSFSKMIGTLVVTNLALAGTIFVVVGWGNIQTVVCASAAGLSTVFLVVGALRQRPQVVITSEGFAFLPLFADRTYKWEDIDGPLAVIKIGTRKAVACKLTAEYKMRASKKPASRFSGFQGYDEVIMGDFRLSAEELAALLNEHKRRSLPSTVEEPFTPLPAEGEGAEVRGRSTANPSPRHGESSTGHLRPPSPPRCEGQQHATLNTHAQPAPPEEAQPQGNGSPILRVAAGVMAILFAVVPLLRAAKGAPDLTGLALMEALALMFGWYAVRGRKGLPRFLSKKLGA